MTSAGGIVSMSSLGRVIRNLQDHILSPVTRGLKHWRKINGFGNNYFGWGGEVPMLWTPTADMSVFVLQDDELHHRLRLNGLLYGDCYPYCGKNDPNQGKVGQSIKRPKKGFGRFSGKYMHSANHTKRITDSRAYARNLEQLREIGSGGGRWKTDGLNSLAFSIVDSQEDRNDQETQLESESEKKQLFFSNKQVR